MIELAIALSLALASLPAGWLLIGPSVLFTLVHTAEEVVCGPFWEYYRERFGFGRISYPAGLLLFVGLALILIGLAVWGYLCGSAFALGVLIGARLGDALLSHIGLRLRFRGANPGLKTSPYYLLEAAVVLWLMPTSAAGLVLGAGAFAGFWGVSFALRLMPRLHSPEEVADELIRGLEDGSITLGRQEPKV